MNPPLMEESKEMKIAPPGGGRPTHSGGSNFFAYLIAALCIVGD